MRVDFEVDEMTAEFDFEEDEATDDFDFKSAFKGDKGDKPVKGVDYMTDEDISEMVDKVLTKVADGTEVAY